MNNCETSNAPQQKKVCVVTGARAEYGLLRPLIARIAEDSGMELRLLVTGSHLCEAFGYTCADIENDGFAIDAKLEMILASDSASGMAKSAGLGMISFADYFSARRPDLLIVLGDRFEIFAAAAAAAMMSIPIAHICGGDTSEGAVDEFMRHSITKMSALHFPSNGESARRILQLGEPPERVYNVGALHVECIRETKLLSREELSADLGINLNGPYALVTYHPVTLNSNVTLSDCATPPPSDSAKSSTDELNIILSALEQIPDMTFIVTKANADSGGRAMNALLEDYCSKHYNSHLYASLGAVRYLSLMYRANAVIGNSSSGLYETPVFGVPAVNIGDRQKGRLCPDNVINCKPVYDDIVLAVQKAISNEFAQYAKQTRNPYGEGDTSRRIVKYIKEYLQDERASLKKSFHNIL